MKVIPTEEWSHFRAALESSGYLKLGPVMSWFSGNIGYHHVHHLNWKTPIYRLPEAMQAIPELQRATVTGLWPRLCDRLLAAQPGGHSDQPVGRLPGKQCLHKKTLGQH